MVPWGWTHAKPDVERLAGVLVEDSLHLEADWSNPQGC
jgi:hypothetical protein